MRRLGKRPPLTDDEQKRLAAMEEKQERMRIQRLAAHHRERAMVPRSYREAKLGVFPNLVQVPDNLTKLARWLRKFAAYRPTQPGQSSELANPGMIALIGRHRSGKSYLACGLINAVLEKGRPARYAKTFTFFQDLKSTIGAAARETQSHVFERYMGYDVLVLDEIQVRSDSAWENTCLRQLIDERDGAGRTTLIMGNVLADQLNDYLGEWLVHRLNEKRTIGLGGIVECDWDMLQLQRKEI